MTKFKGFDKIAELKYEQKVSQCDRCGNLCEVTEIRTPDSVLHHGDRCERYSGLKKRKSDLPNYFEQREKILMSYHTPNDGKKIGLARVGLFYEVAPFFFKFFNELGMNVVLSDKTNRRIVSEGVERTTAEFCFPIKVAFGQYHNLVDKAEKREVDYVFVPDVIEAYPSKFSSYYDQRTGWQRSSTCPYLQNFHSLITSRIGNGKILDCHMSFREGSLEKALFESLKKLDVSMRQVSVAVEAGENAYFDFKSKIGRRGKDVLDDLKKGIVLIGRPYTTYDSSMNLNLVNKIRDLGYNVIPQDFLPLPKEDLSEKWKNEFAIQGQLFLNAARVLRDADNLEAVFLDYFGCGPNSFIKTFFQEEIGRPYLTLQVDEHTADAGVVTRLEAFLDSLKW